MQYILKNEEGKVVAVKTTPDDENYEPTEDEYVLDYKNEYVLKSHTETAAYEEKKTAYETYMNKCYLRIQRSTECFPIINRGQLWYETLTEGQKAELAEWYQAWLDVTKTKTVPTPPVWLK